MATISKLHYHCSMFNKLGVETCQWSKYTWRSCRSVLKWSLGHSLWWYLGWHRCWSGVFSDGILQTRYTVLGIRELIDNASTILFFFFFLQIGSVSRTTAYFGSSSYGPVSIGSIQCSGSETRLQDCGLSQSPSSACTHSQDAGVTCVGKCELILYWISGRTLWH